MKKLIATFFIGATIIIAVFIFSNAYRYKFKTNENITVTGLAENNFTSDNIVWMGNYSRKMMDLKTAYSLLKIDEGKIRNYLKSKGLTDNELVFSAVAKDKEYTTKIDTAGKQAGQEFNGFNLKQNISIDLKEIVKIEKISREITEIIETGIEFNSAPPAYYYT